MTEIILGRERMMMAFVARAPAKVRVFQALHASGTDPARAKKLAAELKKKSPDFLREVKLTLAS